VAEIWARMLGILRLTISLIFSLLVISRPSRMYDSSSSLFFAMDDSLVGAKLRKKTKKSADSTKKKRTETYEIT
jgi:hypothetical protein